MTNIIWHPLNDTHPDIGWRYLDTSNNLMYPWYTFGCLEWLNTLDLRDMSVFEYGCGISTLWWNSKVKKCKGVDNNLKFLLHEDNILNFLILMTDHIFVNPLFH